MRHNNVFLFTCWVAISVFIIACGAPAPIDVSVPEISGVVVRVDIEKAIFTAVVNDIGSLFWVLYTDGVAGPPDSAALIEDAGKEVKAPLVASSGKEGLLISQIGEVEITIPALPTDTNYDLYLVFQDIAGNISAVSGNIALNTPDTIAPTFDVPKFNPTPGGGTVTIENISEAGVLYWAVYKDDVVVPADAEALIADSGSVAGDVVAASGTGVAVDTAQTTITLTGLQSGATYDFYFTIQDAAGNAKVSEKMDIDIPDTVAPTFSAPTFANATASGGTVTIQNISEAGTLFWAVYSDGAPAPADAAALRTVATGSTGGDVIAVSGSGTAVGAGNHSLSLTTLAENTSYDFYAIIRDAAGNLSLLSPTLNLTTLDITAPTFGTLTFTSPTASGGTVTIPNISEAGTLFWAVYSDGATAPASAAALRTVASGSTGGDVIAVSGSGTAVGAGNHSLSLTTLAENTSYDFYAIIRDAAGNLSLLSPTLNLTTLDITAPTFGTLTFTSPTASGGTVTIPNISEAGTLFWVVYSDGATAPADAAALRTVASSSTGGDVVAVSGSGTAVGAGNHSSSLTTLADDARYDFYAVISDAAGNLSALSPTLNLTTLNATAPTFDAPTFANPTASGGTVTIPNISEAGTLFWAVYADNAPAPADAAALRTVATGTPSGNVIAVSGSGTAVGAGIHSLSLTTLAENTSYDFYTAIVDVDNNLSARSLKLDFTTLDITAPTFDTPIFINPTASGGTVSILDISEAGTLFWAVYSNNAPAPASAAALRAVASGTPSGNVIAVNNSGTAVGAGNYSVSLTTLDDSTSYDFYAVIGDAAGNLSTLSPRIDITTLDATAPIFNAPTFANPSIGGGTVTIPNISESGTLFWAVYSNGSPAPADAAALRTVATGNTGGNVIAVSGDNISIGTGTRTLSISALAHSTSYEFYAVIRDAAGNLSALSPKLVFMTIDITAPTFDTPTFANATASGGTVTIPNISEAGTLFWAVYSDGSPAPANANALRTVATGSIGGNVIAVSGSSTAVSAGNATILLTTLAENTSYDFYAVIRDAIGNLSTLSPILNLTTLDTTAPTFDTPTFANPTASGGTVTIPSISEASGRSTAIMLPLMVRRSVRLPVILPLAMSSQSAVVAVPQLVPEAILSHSRH